MKWTRYALRAVAGTNGKGSVSAMIDPCCVRRPAYRALHDPRLIRFERIRIRGEMIPDDSCCLPILSKS